MPTSQPVTGHCLCGRVSLSARQLNRDVVYCHCKQCQRQSGLYYAATDVLDEDLSITDDDALTWYAASDSAKRGFCRHCGSTLFWKANDSHKTSVMAGCLNAPTGLQGIAHIYVADKGDYYTLDDGLEQHAQGD